MGHIRVDLPNTNNKWVGFGLVNVDTFIIRVGFGLTNVDTIRILTRHEHDPIYTNSHPYSYGFEKTFLLNPFFFLKSELWSKLIYTIMFSIKIL